jgi:hypothetical protein
MIIYWKIGKNKECKTTDIIFGQHEGCPYTVRRAQIWPFCPIPRNTFTKRNTAPLGADCDLCQMAR